MALVPVGGPSCDGGEYDRVVRVTTLRSLLRVRYGRFVRRPIALLLVLGSGLGVGATALAQGGGSDELSIDMQRGCLTARA